MKEKFELDTYKWPIEEFLLTEMKVDGDYAYVEEISVD